MSDPLRTDGTRARDGAPAPDRDAKIEQLLLLGLDHYFAARYELAINVWTRALFLDRSHPRARAYIERARSALAERQRESEELLQKGIAAFHRRAATRKPWRARKASPQRDTCTTRCRRSTASVPPIRKNRRPTGCAPTFSASSSR